MVSAMHSKLALSSAAVFLLLVACNNDPGKDKAKAQVSEPTSAIQTTPAKNAVRYAFSAADSKLNFVGAKITKKHEGSFGAFSGKIEVSDADPTKSTVSFEVDTATLAADDPKLTGHLKSPDFFDVAKFPNAKFTSTSIKAGGENGASHTVTGNLEMHGVTKTITVPVTVKYRAESAATKQAGFAGNVLQTVARFDIKLSDYGIKIPAVAAGKVANTVQLVVSSYATTK